MAHSNANANLLKDRSPALLVIDVQERFRSMVSDHMMREVNATIAWARKHKLPIIFTQHGHRYLHHDAGELGEWFQYDLSIVGDDSWQLLPELDFRKDDDILIDEKRRYDAFHNTPLESILRWKQVDTVIVVGVMTNLCCETTARGAFQRDFRVLFPSDGNGTSSQECHEATLKNIAFGFGKVMTCAEVRQMK